MDISPLSRITPPAVPPKAAGPAPSATGGFGEVMQKLTEDYSAKQQQADALVLKAAVGEPMELHEAVLAMEQANLSLHLALQVRNKLVEAYQEVMRMQV
jgi:flagellar hook-basal body complex protein FliE